LKNGENLAISGLIFKDQQPVAKLILVMRKVVTDHWSFNEIKRTRTN
jgi:hypothetical protein